MTNVQHLALSPPSTPSLLKRESKFTRRQTINPINSFKAPNPIISPIHISKQNRLSEPIVSPINKQKSANPSNLLFPPIKKASENKSPMISDRTEEYTYKPSSPNAVLLTKQ